MNIEGGQGLGEADTGVYGGDNPNDNSGILRYVRVEFAGVEFSPDNELNGIAFQGVGRGSTYEFIQVHMNRDDALEWFGGTADIKYAVASNAADDSFDWTFGWTGRAQFIAIHQRGDDADNGIEADNNEFNNNLLPRSNPQIYNMTICGDPDANEGAESVRAAQLPSRHGVHDPQLPRHRLQDALGCRSTRRQHARAGRQRDDADRAPGSSLEHRLTPLHASIQRPT